MESATKDVQLDSRKRKSGKLKAEDEQSPIARKLLATRSRKLLADELAEASVMPFEEDSDDDDLEITEQQSTDLSIFIQSVSELSQKSSNVSSILTETYAESGSNFQPKLENDISLDDLVGGLTDASGFGGLRKTLQKLDATIEALEKPISNVQQDRLSREAAYEESKRLVSKWKSFVNENRSQSVKTFLEDAQVKPTIVRLENIGRVDKPSNDFEAEIDSILSRCGLKKEGKTNENQLETNVVTKEEIMERQAQLRKMRETLFFYQQKMHRIKKIKSKSYRKILKKEKAKKDLSEDQLASLDPALAEKLRTKRELERAKERLTLKHTNTKWAKKLARFGSADPSNRSALTEQIKRHRDLTKKIQGGSSSEDESATDDEEDEKDGDEASIGSEEPPTKVKGLFGMRFMQRTNKGAAMEKEGKDEEKAMEESDVVGRRSFKGVGTATMAESHDGDKERDGEEDEEGDEDELKSKSGKKFSSAMSGPLTISGRRRALVDVVPFADETEKIRSESGSVNETSALTIVEEVENPWLVEGSRSLRAVTTSQTTSEAKIVQRMKNDAREKTMNATELDPKQFLRVGDDHGTANDVVSRNSRVVRIAQKDLLEEAFANDHVFEKDFASEKDALISQAVPETRETELPGWGSWGGEGVRPRRNQAQRRREQEARQAALKAAIAASRKDAKLDHVIINREIPKKAAKYVLSNVPFPYTSADQYELAMRNPVGPEWNTRTSVRKLVQPKIPVKAGVLIEPPQLVEDESEPV